VARGMERIPFHVTTPHPPRLDYSKNQFWFHLQKTEEKEKKGKKREKKGREVAHLAGALRFIAIWASSLQRRLTLRRIKEKKKRRRKKKGKREKKIRIPRREKKKPVPDPFSRLTAGIRAYGPQTCVRKGGGKKRGGRREEKGKLVHLKGKGTFDG